MSAKCFSTLARPLHYEQREVVFCELRSCLISEPFLTFQKCVSNLSFDFNFRYFVTKRLKSVFVRRINILKLGLELHTKTTVDSNNNKLLSFVHSRYRAQIALLN